MVGSSVVPKARILVEKRVATWDRLMVGRMAVK